MTTLLMKILKHLFNNKNKIDELEKKNSELIALI